MLMIHAHLQHIEVSPSLLASLDISIFLVIISNDSKLCVLHVCESCSCTCIIRGRVCVCMLLMQVCIQLLCAHLHSCMCTTMCVLQKHKYVRVVCGRCLLTVVCGWLRLMVAN